MTRKEFDDTRQLLNKFEQMLLTSNMPEEDKEVWLSLWKRVEKRWRDPVKDYLPNQWAMERQEDWERNHDDNKKQLNAEDMYHQ